MMRKEHYIFFVFMLSAAMVFGYTLAFASSYKVIMNTNTPSVVASIDAEAPAPLDEVQQSQCDCVACTQMAAVSPPTEVMVITPQEQEEIEEMLRVAGMQDGQDPQEFLVDFQTQQNLHPTGGLDSITLNTLINQTKIQKACQQINS